MRSLCACICCGNWHAPSTWKSSTQAHSNEPTADWLNHDVPGAERLIEEELSRAEWAAPLRDAVRIDTVDSYQAAENALLILSLVRNNDKGLQGFLVDQSRINVALSRAKDRLVIIGSKRMWSGVNAPSALGSVVRYVSEQHAISPDDYEIVDGTTVIEASAMNDEYQAADASGFRICNTISLLVPAYQYQINCAWTKEVSLPAVEEFTCRLLLALQEVCLARSEIISACLSAK
ncbi:AAA domain-containing protein [Pseudomonas aeruginosa]